MLLAAEVVARTDESLMVGNILYDFSAGHDQVKGLLSDISLECDPLFSLQRWLIQHCGIKDGTFQRFLIMSEK